MDCEESHLEKLSDFTILLKRMGYSDKAVKRIWKWYTGHSWYRERWHSQRKQTWKPEDRQNF